MTADDDRDRVLRVEGALRLLGFEPHMLIHDASTHTAVEAAQAAGCELGQIVKTLVVEVAGNPTLILVSGDRKLDDRLLASRFGVGRKQVKLARANRVLELTGYPVGGVSPFGMPRPMPVLVDTAFNRFDVLWLAGGTASAIFPMPVSDVLRFTNAELAEVST